MQGKVFILEDDQSISGLVKVALELNGAQCAVFGTLAEFTAALIKDRPDVALLDIMLPDGNGLDALQHLKRVCPDAACILLSALSKEEDKVRGLNLGADDYIAKPFSVLELTARVNARLRGRQQSAVLKAGNVTLNTDTMACRINGQDTALNRKEFELLRCFLENAGKVLSREKLLTAVWGYDGGETRTLDNHVARLRKAGVAIETVFGVGYKL